MTETTRIRGDLLVLKNTAPASIGRGRRRLWPTYFIDLSSNNGRVDFRLIAKNARRTGITCAEIKATEGVDYVNPMFADWREQARRCGIRTFAYHFARPDLHPARLEAEHFCNIVGKVESWEWRPMLDWETAPFTTTWVVEWNKHVRERLGVAPTLYSYGAALAAMGLEKPLSAGLIFAYPNGIPRASPCPPPWRRWTAHQYSWNGRVLGVDGRVDLNWTPNVWPLYADPVKGAAWEPTFKARRLRA